MVAGMAAGMVLHGLYAGWSRARAPDETGGAGAAAADGSAARSA
jgi:hypothetical protein